MSEVNEDVLWRAIEVLCNHDRAVLWLNTPCPELGGALPILLTRNTAGIELVLATLEKMEDGSGQVYFTRLCGSFHSSPLTGDKNQLCGRVGN